MTEQTYQPSYPDYSPDYVPNVVEVYDELGLLACIEKMQLTHNASRELNFVPQIILWYFDGSESENLAYAHSTNTVLINRIGQMKILDDLSLVLGGES